jgi:hypothetical protein
MRAKEREENRTLGGRMRNIGLAIIMALVLGFAGMTVGYGIFGKIGEKYVDLNILFSTNKNFLQKAVRSMAGIDEMRSKILWCGAGGAALGLIFGLFPGKKG